jgi:hypothetical protein
MSHAKHPTQTQPHRAKSLSGGLCAFLALLAIAALAPAAASAAQLHAFSTSFGAPGTGAGQLRLLPLENMHFENGEEALAAPGSGLAVNRETGDIYLADTGNHRVDEFESDGNFLRAFGWEVDAEHPEAKLQVCTTATGCQVGSSGHEPGQLEAPVFIAVDNDLASPSHGDVYVGDYADDSLVTKFGPGGELISTWGNNGPAATPNGQLNGSPTELFNRGFPNARLDGIFVDAAGNLWVASINGRIFEFAQSGAFSHQLHATINGTLGLNLAPAGLALNSTGDFFLPTDRGLTKSGPDGVNIGHVEETPGVIYVPRESDGSELSTAIDALALDPRTEDVYLDEGHNGRSQVLDIAGGCEPSEKGCRPSQEFGAAQLSEAGGLALAPDGTLYAADAGPGHIAVFGVSLEASVQPATEVEATGAVLHGTVDPRGGEVTTCSFQVGPDTTYGQNLPCLDGSGNPVGTLTGNAPIAVHAEASGLEAGAAHHFRLRILDSAGEELLSEDGEVETEVLPRIEKEEASEITATTATLGAEVNPRGPAVSSCRIEWGPTAEPGNPAVPYEHTEPCRPPTLPAGTSPLPVTAHLEGLAPQTSYHWRVAATDENGTETSPENTFVFLPGPPSAEVDQQCENQALREANSSTALPDCRAYEMVTPPDKKGATVDVLFNGVPPMVAQSGSRVFTPALQCFGGALSCNAIRGQEGVTYEFARTSAGWATTPLTPPATRFTAAEMRIQNPDSAYQMLSVSQPANPPAQGREWLYGLGPEGALAPIGPTAEGVGPVLGHNSVFGALATADLSHVVFSADANPWPAFDQSEPLATSTYEYAGAAEHPFLVAVTGGRESTDLIGVCGSTNHDNSSGNSSLSADGRTVIFYVERCSSGGSGPNAGHSLPVTSLYARIDGESAAARTVAISRFHGPGEECPSGGGAAESACRERSSPSQCGVGAAPDEVSCREALASPSGVKLVSSSTDASRIYFLSTQQLTDQASEDSLDSAFGSGGCEATQSKGGCNLYLFSDPQENPLTGRHLTAVSAGDTSGRGPQVQGVMAVSSDGNRVYFVARGLLAGANAEGADPDEGADNLYVYDASEETSRFIATLPAVDEFNEVAQWGNGTEGLEANVSADGRYLLFVSGGRLTPDRSHEGSQQVYRYDALAEKLTRISIGRRGFNDNGNAGTGNAQIAAAVTAKAEFASGRPPLHPSMSGDGRRVFFESPVALAPGALDDVPINAHGGLAENVYEWEEEGKGDCQEASGCIYLISDGRDATEGPISHSGVGLLGTDASGDNVFFFTNDPLVPADGDGGRDFYDARVDGGFAPPPSPVPCQGDACKGQGTQTATEATPGTPTFNGPGNEKPLVCKKGQVQKHGKCVKPKTKHKKHHKKKGNKKHQRANTNRRAGK